MISLLPSLGHEPDRFKWMGQTIRAWSLKLESLPEDISELVYKKVVDDA